MSRGPSFRASGSVSLRRNLLKEELKGLKSPYWVELVDSRTLSNIRDLTKPGTTACLVSSPLLEAGKQILDYRLSGGSNLRLTEVQQVSPSPRTDIARLSFVGMRSN